MTDALRRLGQISNQVAQDATNDLQNLAEKQNEALGDKEQLRSVQNKLQSIGTSGDSNADGISYGISATKDGFETSKPDHLAGLLSTPAAVATPVHTLATAMTQSKTAISEFLGAGSNTVSGDMMATMMAYQKEMNKEAQQNRKLESSSKDAELISLQSKIAKDNQAIDQGMKEAREKADIAREQATMGLVMGVAGGIATMGAGAAASSMGTGASSAVSAFSELANHAAKIRDAFAQKSGGTAALEFESRYQKLISLLNQHSESAQRQSDQLQININKSEEIDQEKDTPTVPANRRAALDAIVKFLDILKAMNPQI